jgi:hypothetical protein
MVKMVHPSVHQMEENVKPFSGAHQEWARVEIFMGVF